jgi:hypothetical protein
LRVSDAERADVTDRLARHYGEGRLDMAEFDQRVTRAVSAKTVGDFQGLFDDLPDLPRTPTGTLAGPANAGAPPTSAAGSGAARRPAGHQTRRQRRRRRGLTRLVLMSVLVIVAATIAWHALTTWIAPVIWLAILAGILLIVSRVRRR